MTSASDEQAVGRVATAMGLNNQKVHAESPSQSEKIKNHMAYLRNPKLAKGLSYTEEERNSLGLNGLLPPAVRSQAFQVQIIMNNIDQCSTELQKYIYLRELQDTDERLFYRVLCENTEKLMPIVYTPIVGKACMEYSQIFRRPRGLYITIKDAGRVNEVIGNWPEKEVKAIVVTDGERILGLGDLGSNGMGIPVGKLSLYTTIGGVTPHQTIPITLDVGTNNESLLSDPMYIGLKQKRATGPDYDDLIDEFMESVNKRYGKTCLVQFEDFGNHNAFRLLQKYKNSHCVFNDDIQGTASVAVAGILAAVNMTGLTVSQNTFLFYGAGEAALGTADLLVMAMQKEGTSEDEAKKKVWLVDSKGLIVKDRPTGGMTEKKEIYAKNFEYHTKLDDIVQAVKPTALIGVSAQPGVFTKDVLQIMASVNNRPIIFALSNPTHKAECTAEDTYKHTEGRGIFASGSPFNPVTINSKTFYPGQGNNAYIFPGVALAVIHCGVLNIPDEVFLVAAKALADQVTHDHMDEGRVYPPLNTIREVSLKIAAEVAKYFYREGIATYKPEPDDKMEFLRSRSFNPNYDGSQPLPQILQNGPLSYT